MTGSVYFGLRFSGTSGLTLGDITFDLTAGLGIRFDRDRAANTNVKMGTINCKRASSHCVETWNIDKLEIGSVIAKNVGECGLLLQKVTNAKVGLVDGDNVAAGNQYCRQQGQVARRRARHLLRVAVRRRGDWEHRSGE
jgi:hypothetical protein